MVRKISLCCLLASLSVFSFDCGRAFKNVTPTGDQSGFTEVKQNTSLQTISKDGAWCWFSDPRAIYVHGKHSGVLTGWVTRSGDIEVGLMKHDGNVGTRRLAAKLDPDDHANPAFVELGDDNQMVFYAKHSDEVVRAHHSVAGEAFSFGDAAAHDPFDSEQLEKYPVKRVTYANPYLLEEENNTLYCFGRWTGYKPNVMTSVDGGKSFSKSRVIITSYPFDANNRPYAKYFSDGKSRIHMTYTDGHPRIEPTNSVYYAYYENGSFFKADGSKITDMDRLPFETADGSLVYQANTTQGRSWIYDIAADEAGNPVILYARYPDVKNHIYHYTKFDGTRWQYVEICNSGSWFPQTEVGKEEREENYSGGMTIHPLDVSVIYVSEEVDGIFEIVRYDLNDKGNEIKSRTPITSNSTYDNIRPYIPRNMRAGDPLVILWMKNKSYVHYTDYDVEIVGKVRR